MPGKNLPSPVPDHRGRLEVGTLLRLCGDSTPVCTWISGCITSRREYTDGEGPSEAAAGPAGTVIAGLEDLSPESDLRDTPGTWKERTAGCGNAG